MTDFGRRPGDMLKSVYDTNADGVVDNSAKLEGSSKAQVQDHTPKTHTHTEAQITDLSHDAQKIKGVVVDDAAKADTKLLAYDLASTTLKYVAAAGGGAHASTHEAGQADVINVTGLVGTTPNAILGDATPGRHRRSITLVIQDGSQANTLKCTASSLFNGDAIAVQDNIVKNATTGHYSLDSNGVNLTILNTGLSGLVLDVMGVILRNTVNADITVYCERPSTGIQISIRDSEAGTALDITTIINAELIILAIAYITDA